VATSVASPSLGRRLRPAVAPAVWLGGTVAFVAAFGIPTTRDWIFAWVLLGALALSRGDVEGWARGVVRDWLPFFATLTLYDLARGGADGLIAPTYYMPQADADAWLFGGAIPAPWLQERLHEPGRVQWFEAAAFAVYLSHFFATPLLAGALWLRERARFRRLVLSLLLLAAMGCATYVLFPAAPPWLASEQGLIEDTTRLMPELWSWVGLGATDGLVGTGYRYANDVAAVPSLHAAVALLVALVLWPRRRWAQALVAAYPIAMAAAIVYTGEHYVVDVLLGWIYAVVSVLAVRWIAARRDARQAELLRTNRAPTSR
jgi:membrane-associated phospholipid phosphatase